MLTALLVIVGIIALLVIVASLRPTHFRITRRTVVAATPDAVFPHVNDLHRWQAWSPWEHLDPTMERSYAGPAAGTGAVYAWEGNRHVGSGRMTITESHPGAVVRLKLEFFKPMACTNQADFIFAPEAGGTAVTWTMTGSNNLMGKVFCLFMNMDKMVGGQFEEGLANLKKVTEVPTQAGR